MKRTLRFCRLIIRTLRLSRLCLVLSGDYGYQSGYDDGYNDRLTDGSDATADELYN